MSDSTRRPAPRLVTSPASRTIGVLIAVLLTVVGFGALASSAAASPRYTAHRTVVRKVNVTVVRAATVTAKATVRGRTASITSTAKAVGRATATAAGRATVTAASASAARAQAVRTATVRAEARARQSATVLAARRATLSAARAARTQATTQAEQAAETLAARAVGGSGSNTHGSTSGDSSTSASTSTSTGSGAQSGGATAACGGESVTKADGTAWTCTFDDEFNGTSLDASKWVAQLTANSGFAPGSACYIDDPNTISVSGGTLNLTVDKLATPISCPSPQGAFSTDYVGGTVSSWQRFSQTYGRYEVRAQLPASTAAGLQETFWLWPNTQSIYGAWPASGEMDFAEFYSQYAGWVIPYLHYNYDTSTASWATNTNIVTAWPAPYNQPGMNCTIDQAGYNTYVFTWQPGRLTIAVNGQNCLIDNYQATNLASPAPFDQPFFLALTQALGVGTNAPTAATPLPATTHVDYVRVWK